MHKPSITAHAGALGTEPNTLESIKACLRSGAQAIEVDVRFLPDGTPALGHDSVRAGSSALLEDCFALLRGGVVAVNLDMKETARAAEVARLAAAYGLNEKAYMTGITASDAHAVQNCGLPYYLNCRPLPFGWGAKRLAAQAKELGAAGLNLHYSRCCARLVRRARARRLPVSVWTVDRRRAMGKMLRLGVDSITTRRPDLLREMLERAP
jgi:glycerophosphoryl diester phosphodiesterase